MDTIYQLTRRMITYEKRCNAAECFPHRNRNSDLQRNVFKKLTPLFTPNRLVHRAVYFIWENDENKYACD